MRGSAFVFAAVVAVSTASGCDAATPTTSVAASSTAASIGTDPVQAHEVDAEQYRQGANSYGLSGYFFRSPGGEFRCAVLDEPATGFSVPVQAACMGREIATPAGQPGCTKRQTGNSPVPGVGVGASGSIFLCVSEPLFYGTDGASGAKVLPIGASLVGNGVSCSSTEGGIDCAFNYTLDRFTIGSGVTELSGGAGAAANARPVPDVLGDRPAVAWQTLEEAGFRAEVVGGSGRGPNGAQCVVVSQDPAAGSRAPADSVVTLRTGEAGAASAQSC